MQVPRGLFDLSRRLKELAAQYVATCDRAKTIHDMAEREQLEEQLRFLILEANSVSVEHRAVSEHFLNLRYSDFGKPRLTHDVHDF